MKRIYYSMVSLIVVMSAQGAFPVEGAMPPQPPVRIDGVLQIEGAEPIERHRGCYDCCSRLCHRLRRLDVRGILAGSFYCIGCTTAFVALAFIIAHTIFHKNEVTPFIRSLHGHCGSCSDISNIVICPMAFNTTSIAEIAAIETTCLNKNFTLTNINCDDACPPCNSLEQAMSGVQKACGGNNTMPLSMTLQQKMNILRKKMADKRKVQR